VLYPTFWFEPTRRSPIADRTFADARVRSPVRAALLRGELRRTIFRSTLLSKFRAFRHNYDAEYMLDEFRALPDVPADSAPTFTFAHFMLPHQPIVLDDRCRPINGEGRIAGMMENPGPTKLFLGAVHCANTQVLGVVSELLRRSATPPIIILVGDHGTISRRAGEKTRAPQDSIVAERLGALGAFYMPDGGAAMFADSSTHVNILRRVFRYYLGADLPDLGNDGFFTAPGSQYRFVPVDERIVIGG